MVLESGILKSIYAAFSIEFRAFAVIMTNFMCCEEQHKQVLKRSFFSLVSRCYFLLLRPFDVHSGEK